MRKQSGFSLVELMIALVIGLLLIAGVIELFVGSKQMYRVQDMKARMQENGRYAIHQISSLISHAGYQGCNSLHMEETNVTNFLNNVSNYEWSFTVPIEGQNATGTTWSPAKQNNINAAQGSDILTVRAATNLYVEVSSHADKTSPITIPAGTAMNDCDPASDNDCANIIMLNNCENAVIFQASNNPVQDGKIEFAQGVGTPGNSAEIYAVGTNTPSIKHTYGSAWLTSMATHTFFVGTSDGEPVLFEKVGSQNAQVLVEGVEQMQVQYGLDDDDDQTVDRYVTADQVNANWDKVISIKIWLVMINPDSQPNTSVAISNPNIYVEGQSIATAQDNQLRQVFTRTIVLRNRGQ